jgi:hypothetical protein
MAVYVDRVRDWGDAVKGEARRWGTRWSHLFADSDDELDAFALRIGLKLKWAQHRGQPGRFHYDVIPTKRAAAVKAGAIEVDDRTAVAIWKRRQAEDEAAQRSPKRSGSHHKPSDPADAR